MCTIVHYLFHGIKPDARHESLSAIRDALVNGASFSHSVVLADADTGWRSEMNSALAYFALISGRDHRCNEQQHFVG